MATEKEDDIPVDYCCGLEECHEELTEEQKSSQFGMLGASPSHSGRKFYIMYHGTRWENALKIQSGGFIPSKDGELGPGVYLSRNFQKAAQFPWVNRIGKLAVLKVSARVGRVKRIDYRGHPMTKTWHQHGYDTAWMPPNCGMGPPGFEEDCVYEPWRIKVLDILPNS